MTMSERAPGIVWVNPGLCYRARIVKAFDPRQDDIYYIGLLRYHYDPKTRAPLECYYWAPDNTWTKYPIGGEYRPIEVPWPYWPQGARDLLPSVSEPNARRALADAIEGTMNVGPLTPG